VVKHCEYAKVKGIHRTLFKCSYVNVKLLGTEQDCITSVQSEQSGTFCFMHRLSIDSVVIVHHDSPDMNRCRDRS
jgi:hypothetical protein